MRRRRSISLAMPKSSSLTCPSLLTSTLAGLMSRWTIRLACACATASSTSRKRRSRASIAERALVAVAVDGLPVDVLEDQIGLAGRRDAGVDEVRDARMAEAREDGAFAPEALFAGAADQRDVQQLDRRAALEPAVAAFGEPDAAACRPGRWARAAGTRRGPDPRATASSAVRGIEHRAFEEAASRARLRGRRASIARSAARRGVARARSRPARRALVPAAISSASSRYGLRARHRSGLMGGMAASRGRTRRCRWRGAGRGGPSPSCAGSVRSETPRIAAISAKEKPQKNFRSTISARPGSTSASSSSASLITDQRLRVGRRCRHGRVPSEVISNSPPRFSDRRRRTSSMISPRMTRAA